MKAMAPVSRSRKRILYIEDQEDSRQMLTTLLELNGYEMATSTTVEGGVSLASLERFDLYILDSRFKDGTGLELCRRIRAFDPDTPIIFFSSAAYKTDIEAGKAAGAQHYLTKPTGIYVIEQTIAGLIASTTEARAYGW